MAGSSGQAVSFLAYTGINEWILISVYFGLLNCVQHALYLVCVPVFTGGRKICPLLRVERKVLEMHDYL